MNQITEMFQESNRRMKAIMDKAGEYSKEQLDQAQREFEGQIKLMNTVIQAFAVASKNKRAMIGLERMNLMDETTAVGFLSDSRENDLIRCPSFHNPITRQECLSRSGSEQHYDSCRGCEIGKATRRLCNITELQRSED